MPPPIDLSELRRNRPRIPRRRYNTAHRPTDEAREELPIGLASPYRGGIGREGSNHMETEDISYQSLPLSSCLAVALSGQ